MVIYDASKEKPKKSGHYLTFNVWHDVGGHSISAYVLQYDADADTWSVGALDKDRPLDVDFWAYLPDAKLLLDFQDGEETCLGY